LFNVYSLQQHRVYFTHAIFLEGIAMKEKIQAVIDEIRPNLQADGGDIEFVNVTAEGIVQVKLQGACSGCPGAAMTLKMGVERLLKSRIPEVKGVQNVG
jgi:Fe-S cluster biogenesis protein NfuA